MKSVRTILKLLAIMPTTLVVGCGGSNPSSSTPISSSSSEISSTSSEAPASRSNPIIKVISDISTASKTSLTGPFVILTEEGQPATLTKDGSGNTGKNIPNEYENMYEAIRVAGTNSTTKNILQVQDANYVQIYKRVKTSQCYIFDGPDYVGNAGQTSAKNYCLAHRDAYAVNGIASDYYYLGRSDMLKNQTVQENVLETFAGAYNYMFSLSGSGAKDLGYRYCTADVLLSEATYIPPSDGGSWNAYIFINLSEGILADLGLIGIKRDSRVEWCLVRNCSSKTHSAGTSGVEKDAKFYVWQDRVVTYSSKYNATTKEYTGFDDLHFEAFTLNNGWKLNITNLRTKQVHSFEDLHKEGDTPVEENTTGISGRALIAASYCPVTGNVWNWDSGAALNNVIWTNISMKKCIRNGDVISQDIEEYRNASQSFELYPDSSTYRDGYSQGSYKASHEFSKFTTSGVLPSGFAYEANQKYISFSVDYRNK